MTDSSHHGKVVHKGRMVVLGSDTLIMVSLIVVLTSIL